MEIRSHLSCGWLFASLCGFACALLLAASMLGGEAYAVQGEESSDSQSALTSASSLFIAESEDESEDDSIGMFRIYNPNSGEHFYTASETERDHLTSLGWKYEGEGWRAPKISSEPVYRVYNPNAGEHHYTLSAGERDNLIGLGWRDEGIGWYSADSSGARVGLYRQYNPNAFACNHNFTLSYVENNHLVDVGWRAEGAAWFGLASLDGFTDGWIQVDGNWRFYQSGAPVSGWLVTGCPPPIGATGGLLQRYWFTPDCSLVVDRIIDPSANSVDAGAYYSYATPHGYIARGKYSTGDGYVYVTDSDGVLPTQTGWLVTDQYDGAWQRYYIDPVRHAAQIGSFYVDGNRYYGMPGYGYVARNITLKVDGLYYSANNDGVLNPDTVVNNLVMKAQGYSSPTRYLIMVDIDNPRCVVFEGRKGNWAVKFIWDCCTGMPRSPTKQGVFKVGSKGYSFGESHGYSCYYWTQFTGNYLFHTRKYWPHTHTIQDARMGERVSSGCVRLYDEAAIWIYNNAPAGTTVVTTT